MYLGSAGQLIVGNQLNIVKCAVALIINTKSIIHAKHKEATNALNITAFCSFQMALKKIQNT